MLLPFGDPSLHAASGKRCEKQWKLLKENWGKDTDLLSASRDYLTNCSTEMDTPQRARLLNHMGEALIRTRQYSEAIPILEECRDLSASHGLVGDLADCWYGLGKAAAYQGWCDAAETGFKAARDVPTTDNLSSAVHEVSKMWLKALKMEGPDGKFWAYPLDETSMPFQVKCLADAQSTNSQVASSGSHLYGTAFFISADGYLLTNDHVVNNCRSVTTSTGRKAQIVSRDPQNDLALLRVTEKRERFATFRLGESPEVSEYVMAFGFPLHGTLSSEGVATSGIISSLAGIQDDPRTMEFSAAVQPGNSGGPLLDGSGHVIGVVEAKLDAVEMVHATGIVPENIGFAIQWAQIRAFLESEGVTSARERSKVSLSSNEIAKIAQQITTAIDCSE